MFGNQSRTFNLCQHILFISYRRLYCSKNCSIKNLVKDKRRINIRRLVSIAVITALLGGLGYYYWFEAIDTLGETPLAIRKKFFLQAFVFTPLFYISFFALNVLFVKTPLKQWFSYKPFKDTIKEIRHKFISVYKNDIVFWAFLHLFTFIFIPYLAGMGGMSDSMITSIKVLFVGSISVGWDAYISRVSNSSNTLFLSSEDKKPEEKNGIRRKISKLFETIKTFTDKYKMYIVLVYGTVLLLSIVPTYSGILIYVNCLKHHSVITTMLSSIFLFLIYKFFRRGFAKDKKRYMGR